MLARAHASIRALLLICAALLPLLVPAQDVPELALPLDCAIGKSCAVQNYVDHGAAAAARDYRCGLLSYAGHKGTDIRVLDHEAYARGVAVLAAAAGRVRAVRDGMPDESVRALGKDAVTGREAGNSVVIEHGAGWETQYAHLRKGSVAVHAGDVVQAGQRLGTVGLSGNTEFPHLHFEVRHQHAIVDPFLGKDAAGRCEAGTHPLWAREPMAALAYVSTGLIDAAIAGAPPSLGQDNVAQSAATVFSAQSPAAVFWVQIYGAQEHDLEELRLLAPDGRVLVERRQPVPGNRAQWLVFAGKRRGPATWAAGTYRGEYSLYRGPQHDKLLSLTREITIEPRHVEAATAPETPSMSNPSRQ